MNILNKVAAAIRRKAAKPGTSPVITPSGENLAIAVRDWYAGAWQKNDSLLYRRHDPLDNATVYSCISLISNQFANTIPQTQRRIKGVWVTDDVLNPNLTMPNRYQTMPQFLAQFATHLLEHGNAYVWNNGKSWRLLNPRTVKIHIATDGSGMTFYEAGQDYLTGITEAVYIPDNQILHARINVFRDSQLIGIGPLHVAAMAGKLGEDARIAAQTAYENSSRPGGIIEVPGAVDTAKLQEMKKVFNDGYGGNNRGQTAVLSDGAKFISVQGASVLDSAVIEALNLSSAQIAAVFNVPAYLVGAGSFPPYSGQVQAMQQFLTTCLQPLITQAESLFNKGLGIDGYVFRRVRFDVSAILRLDPQTEMAVIAQGVGAGILSPNEGRAKLNLPAVKGGDSPYLQQQNYPLEALYESNSANGNSGSGADVAPAPADGNAPPPETDEEKASDIERAKIIKEMKAAAKVAKVSPGIYRDAARYLKSVPADIQVAAYKGCKFQRRYCRTDTGATICTWSKA